MFFYEKMFHDINYSIKYDKRELECHNFLCHMYKHKTDRFLKTFL